MSVNAVIGSKGFVGSRIKWYADTFMAKECVGIHRENYKHWEGHTFDTLIWAAGSARKNLSEAELLETNCLNVQKAIQDFGYRKVVYVSSQAVYPWYSINSTEDTPINPAALSSYGLSKYLGEVVVRESCYNYLILRPNGFVGPGLKKNMIFDLTKTPPETYYDNSTAVQFIHTDVFGFLVFMLSDTNDREVFNVAIDQPVGVKYASMVLGIDDDDVVHKKSDRMVAIFSTNKLYAEIHKHNIRLPAIEETIELHNQSLEVQVPNLWGDVGQSGSQ